MHPSTRLSVFPPSAKGRPSDIPIETRDEPKDTIYQTQEESISPLKETLPKFQLSVKQAKLRGQTKTKSVEEQVEQRVVPLGIKQSVKRATSDRLQNIINPIKSPTNGEFNLTNHNAAFGLKPALVENPANFGYERKTPFHNIITEEKDEISNYAIVLHSSDTVHGNQIVSNNRENVDALSPIGFENEVPILAPRKMYLNHQLLEETLTPKLKLRPREDEPIYENFPFRVANQSDSYLQEEVLRLRAIIGSLGNFKKIEECSKEISRQRNVILELELKNEKLKRDNRILKADSEQKEQTIKSMYLNLDQQIDRNKYLQQELSKAQAVTYCSKQPPRYGEDVRYYEQHNKQFRNEPPQPIESRRLSYRSDNAYYPNLAPLAAQSDLRIPRSLPNGGLANIPNIPLNAHLNGGYPASHDPKGTR